MSNEGTKRALYELLREIVAMIEMLDSQPNNDIRSDRLQGLLRTFEESKP